MPFGRVIDFDDHVGLGHVEADNGAVHLFHCVEIADGTRTIDVGAEVEFDVMVKFGDDEAANLRLRSTP
jgi:cold shock CspA family protein